MQLAGWPERLAEYLAALREVLPAARASPSCIYLHVGQSMTEPGVFVLSEGWKDRVEYRDTILQGCSPPPELVARPARADRTRNGRSCRAALRHRPLPPARQLQPQAPRHVRLAGRSARPALTRPAAPASERRPAQRTCRGLGWSRPRPRERNPKRHGLRPPRDRDRCAPRACLAYSVIEGARPPADYHHASFEVHQEGHRASRLIWTTDILPHALAARIRIIMERGAIEMKEAIEAAAPAAADHGTRPGHESLPADK